MIWTKMRKNTRFCNFPPGVRGATPTPPSIVTSIVDPAHIKVLFPELGPCVMYEIEETRRYLPQSGGIVFATDEKSFALTGFIFTDYADPLKHPQDSFTKYNQILPFPRELNHIFENAKNFMLNRTGETLTEGTSLQYNYRALAEFTKSQMGRRFYHHFLRRYALVFRSGGGGHRPFNPQP